MNPTPFHSFLRSLVPALVLLALTPPLEAQSTSRPPTTTSGVSSSAPRPASSSNGSGGSSSNSGVRQYNSNTMMGNATIQIDPETRSVVVVTDEQTNLEIAKVINNLDRPKPQVLIKVVFVEIDLDKSSDIGMQGSYTFKVGNGSTSSSGTSTTTTNQTVPTLGGNTITNTVTNNPAGINSSAATLSQLYGMSQTGSFLALTNGNWSATLAALNTHNNLHILSRPSIMARNNQQAVIVVGKEVPMVTNSQITDTGQTNNTITYKDVGIILRVTPFISANRTIEMIVAPEISQLDSQTVQVSNNVSAPIIDKRSAETVVVTPDATTVVIGGLMQKQTTSTIQKIPILGDIPVLGFPFRRTVKDDYKNELLIFLTPYIVENPQTLKDLTRESAAHADLDKEPMYRDELNRGSLEEMQLPGKDETKESAPTVNKAATPGK